MHSRCCCPPDISAALLCKLSLTSSQKRRAAQALFDDFVQIAAVIDADDTQSVNDIFVNAFWKWIPFLKNHADPTAQVDDVHRRIVNILAVELDLAPCTRVVQHQIVHAVQATQQGRLAATGGADEGGRFLFGDFQIDGFESALLAVIKVDILDAKNLFHRLAAFSVVITEVSIGFHGRPAHGDASWLLLEHSSYLHLGYFSRGLTTT